MKYGCIDGVRWLGCMSHPMGCTRENLSRQYRPLITFSKAEKAVCAVDLSSGCNYSNTSITEAGKMTQL